MSRIGRLLFGVGRTDHFDRLAVLEQKIWNSHPFWDKKMNLGNFVVDSPDFLLLLATSHFDYYVIGCLY